MPLKLSSCMTGDDNEERAMKWARHCETPAIETWLHGQLHARYDETLKEQVPDEMLRLAEAVAGKP